MAFEREIARARRKQRIRKDVNGTSARPRLCVYRSLRHIYAQIVDDAAGHTLVAASTKEVKAGKGKSLHTIAGAQQVGELIAERALAKSIRCIVFDRGGYRYHGRVKAVADAARAKGLEF